MRTGQETWRAAHGQETAKGPLGEVRRSLPLSESASPIRSCICWRDGDAPCTRLGWQLQEFACQSTPASAEVSVTSVSMSPESTEILLIDLISLKGSEFGDGSFVIVQPPDRSQFYLAPLRLSQKDDFQKDGNHAIARDCRLLELKLTCNYHHYKIHINLFLAMKLILSSNLDELPAIN
ncbi:Transducin Beta-Like Protein 3 [Manis pentadactyla]|nr:Transducin Beta-Like Protein 3 [Manis pentadactyla]